MERKSSVEVQSKSIKELEFKSLKRSLDVFGGGRHYNYNYTMMKKIRISHKLGMGLGLGFNHGGIQTSTSLSKNIEEEAPKQPKPKEDYAGKLQGSSVVAIGSSSRSRSRSRSREVFRRPWKNYRVISGHGGSVRSIAFDPRNDWFCTGSADRSIKIWDVATGTLRLTLLHHRGQVRALAVSKDYTYMFSAGDDTQVLCWDLEQNKVVRSYHGHLSGVYSMALHPGLGILLTGGRDSVCRVWDVRTKVQVHALEGHKDAVCSVFSRVMDPQVVTGSHDSTIKLWDIRYGKTMVTLTHHKKSVRAMVEVGGGFASASADGMKRFGLPNGEFCYDMYPRQGAIVNSMAVNGDGVLASGGDDGSIWFWDWERGRAFQRSRTVPQPGSLESEAGIYALSFAVTGSRLVTCEADKTIKMWKEDESIRRND